ncbi:MAG: thiamine diphosphokinase [Acidimicrobiales bacterium]
MDQRRDSALIVLGGDAIDDVVPPTDALPGGTVIAVDSGIDLALRLGLVVDVAVGDFDSVSVDGLDTVRRAGAEIHQHPVDKDHTDFELALEVAVERQVSSVDVIGGEGGRLDHLLANAFVMAAERFASLDITAHGPGGSRVCVVRGQRRLTGTVGELVSLLAVQGPAVGVSTTHLRYPLHGELLDPGSTRGVSNQLTGPVATVTVDSGVLLAVMPGSAHITGTRAVTDAPHSTPDHREDPSRA